MEMQLIGALMVWLSSRGAGEGKAGGGTVSSDGSCVVNAERVPVRGNQNLSSLRIAPRTERGHTLSRGSPNDSRGYFCGSPRPVGFWGDSSVGSPSQITPVVEGSLPPMLNEFSPMSLAIAVDTGENGYDLETSAE